MNYTGRGATHHEVQSLGGSDVDAVSERGDHESRSVAQILVIVRHDRIQYGNLGSLPVISTKMIVSIDKGGGGRRASARYNEAILID